MEPVSDGLVSHRRKRRSRGVYWSIFTPALITWSRKRAEAVQNNPRTGRRAGVGWHIGQAKFEVVKSLDTFDFLAIPSLK